MAKTKLKLKKLTKRQVWRFILNAIIIILGNAIASAGVAFFIDPSGFVMGGTTGLGIFVKNLLMKCEVTDPFWTTWAVQITVYTVNIALFVLGCILLGKKFAITTAAGTFLFPTFLTVYGFIKEAWPGGSNLGLAEPLGHPLLAMIFGSLLFGFGVGIVVRVGASTGGSDIPPLIFKKYFNAPISVTMWIVDFSIVAINFFVTAPENVMYGILITLISSFIVGKISPVGMRRTQVKIISTHYEEIREMILTKISRGVTVLYGETGYLKADCKMLLTVISHRQLVQLKSEVQKIDPNAFITISEVSEVRGRGFHSDGVDFLMPNSTIEEEDASAPKKEEPPRAEN